jgi:peptidoglycan/LPS O-acetylase OafA/YrhL
LRSKNIAYNEKLDHVRFFAAMFVILFHCVILFESLNLASKQVIYDNPFTRICLEGGTGVSLFMTLSGFLFARICHNKDINLWQFYRNRLLRIYPLFMFVLLMACCIDPQRNDLLALFRSIFLMHNFKDAVYVQKLTEVLWTIPVEFQFYALFPFLLIFYRKSGIKYLFLLIALAVATKAAVYGYYGSVHLMAYTTIFGRIDQFVMGIILGFSFDKLKKYFESPLVFFAIFSVTLFGLWYVAVPPNVLNWPNSAWWIVRNLIEGVAFGFLILSYEATTFSLPRLASRLVAFGGTLSFSLYVDHFFVLQSCEHLYVPLVYGHHSRYPFLCQMASWLQTNPLASLFCYITAVELPLTLLASLLTYFVIEKPFLSLRTEYIVNRPATVLAPLAPVLPIDSNRST